METTKIWLITGASQGLGLTLVKHLLANNQTVIATTRDADKFDPDLRKNPNLEVISLDLMSETAVKSAVGALIEKYGRIDMLVNNAGHGFLGAIEEASPEEIVEVIDINVLATLRTIRQVLPFMRAARSGRIINLSSMAGLMSAAGVGIYNLSKYAVEGFSEALNLELAELGIRVLIVEPGAFRTNFLAGSMANAKRVIADYDTTAGKSRRRLQGNNGHQPNDPEKAARAIFDAALMENPPLRLLLGKDAADRAAQKIALLQTDFDRMKTVTLSTGF